MQVVHITYTTLILITKTILVFFFILIIKLMQEFKTELLVDGVPYFIKAVPFNFNIETR